MLAAAGAGGSGCMLLRKGAAQVVTPVAKELSDGFMRQTDVELVREGAPAFLLMLDALAEAHPDKPAVLVAAVQALRTPNAGDVAIELLAACARMQTG